MITCTIDLAHKLFHGLMIANFPSLISSVSPIHSICFRLMELIIITPRQVLFHIYWPFHQKAFLFLSYNVDNPYPLFTNHFKRHYLWKSFWRFPYKVDNIFMPIAPDFQNNQRNNYTLLVSLFTLQIVWPKWQDTHLSLCSSKWHWSRHNEEIL